MICAVLSLANNAFGMAFDAWLKFYLPVMLAEAFIELALMNIDWRRLRNDINN